jgi:hypothetical protein
MKRKKETVLPAKTNIVSEFERMAKTDPIRKPSM